MPRDVRIVFLDCDGVVSPLSGRSCFHPPQMRLLRSIVDTTGAEIVLSSSWRTTEWGRKEVGRHLTTHGIRPFIDVTPDEPGVSRAKEILRWISRNSDKYRVLNFVALDDIDLPSVAPDRKFFESHAVTTEGLTGLTEEDARRAIALLHSDNDVPRWPWDEEETS